MHSSDWWQPSSFFGDHDAGSLDARAFTGLAVLREALQRAADAQRQQDAQRAADAQRQQDAPVTTLYIGSSALDTARYDPDSASLQLGFDSGHVYQFFGFPPSAWDSFRRAGSYGQHFNSQIRNRYTYRRIR